ncbi:TonB-dependent receptor domain-containing protein [uncultured Hyphomonas sp.]|uniref:TonB-dependent receptor domain-containing protein n=1 Tax=uncultured Hyphomonas sp. TaxID=225298 RepID=UPI002AAAD59A|nr:TonB-dependent receptor [uncultured Hyphomonas sp.]
MKTVSPALRALLLAGVASSALPVMAQETGAASESTVQDETRVEDKIVVVGSYIEGVGDSGALPVTVLGREELDVTGALSTGDLLVNIPSVGDLEFSDGNTGTNGARGDVTGINLRGLGSGRSLVLVNGRRITGHPQSEAVDGVPVTFFNVNSVPSTLIERVEVLRDGASALYGSDAIAGVVNLSLFDEYDKSYVTAQYGASTETDLAEYSIGGRTGFEFNGGRTHITVGGSYYGRDPVSSCEMGEWFCNLDRRELLPESWQGDTQFDNRSTIGPYGRFQVGVLNPDGTFDGTAVAQNGTNLTASSGVFHMQPDDFPGSRATIGGGISIDDGTQDRDLRYNFNETQIAIPDMTRFNIASTFSHELQNGVELFGEAMYYDSESTTQRAAGPFDQSLALIIVPASNYYNPFGAVGSPNRLPDTDAPAEGLDIVIQGYRPLEMGPRIIKVDQDLYRLLGGARWEMSGWDVETALGYSEATARDEEFNRISKTLLQDQIALSTPDAFNPFGGPDANSAAVLEQVRVSSVRYGESALTTWDIKATRPDLFTLPGGDVGVAVGIDYRKEEVSEDSDPRLDGTIQFTNGAIPDESDLVGVSATRDFSGERDVWSAFTELQIPIVGEGNRVPGIYALDLQLAARFEDSSDFGDTLNPKIAGHWFITPGFSLRAAYGEGFRAPNLVQINQGTITRRNQGDADPYREDVVGTPNDVGDTYRPSIREGNPDLDAEESESQVFGLIFQPVEGPLDGLRFSLDYWKVETTNAITTLGVDRLLDDDFASLIAGGAGSPNVIRAALTQEDIDAFAAYNLANPTDQRVAVGEVQYVIDGYVNLDGREVEGYDIAASYDFRPGRFGDFSIGASATKLETYNETRDGAVFDELRRNGNPEWRASMFTRWSLGPWKAGAQLRYVSDVFDTSATNDDTGEDWKVDEWMSVNGFVGYSFGEDTGILSQANARLGVRNLFDEAPPKADESAGYLSGLYSVEGRVVYLELSKTF